MIGKFSPLGLICIALTVALTVAGQLLVKTGMLQVGGSPAQVASLPRFVLRAFLNPFVAGGVLCAIFAAMTWTVAVSRSALSLAYPFLALGTVLVVVLSGVIFGEGLPVNRWVGVIVVCVGIIIATR